MICLQRSSNENFHFCLSFNFFNKLYSICFLADELRFLYFSLIFQKVNFHHYVKYIAIIKFYCINEYMRYYITNSEINNFRKRDLLLSVISI